jgi:hypothetical protein
MKATHRGRSNAAGRIGALLLLAGIATAAPAQATMQHLDDRQLAQVQGRATLSAQQLYDNVMTPIVAWSAQNDLRLAGSSAATPAQLQTLQFDANDWLSFFGLHYNGPSMGTFTLGGVDTSGLSLTLQPHH